MQLPFTREQFFDLFVAYNEAVWPAVVALWIVSTVIVARRLSAPHQHDRWVSALLVGHWAWSALAYHVAFFTRRVALRGALPRSGRALLPRGRRAAAFVVRAVG
jgi:Family of unknown function (DUF6064)